MRREVTSSRLVCTRCGRSTHPGLAVACDCGGTYETAYDWAGLASWRPGTGPDRFANLLPLLPGTPRITMGEGDTPLVRADGALLKCEHLNPTGSYKDRIASIGVSLAAAAGARGWVGTSSGNSGAAFAAYGARAGLRGTVYSIGPIPDQKRAQIEFFGATLRTVQARNTEPETETELFRTVAARATRDYLALAITARSYNAAAMDGAKTIAFELVEQLGRPPDAVFVPTGGGGLVASVWRGFDDLFRLGITPTRPRMIVAQPAGCAPIHAAIRLGMADVPPIRRCGSAISGLQLVAPPDGRQALEAVAASNGYSVAVTDADALAAQAALAHRHGILVEPAAAVAFAAFTQSPGTDASVVVLTGSGLKTPLPTTTARPPIAMEEIGRE